MAQQQSDAEKARLENTIATLRLQLEHWQERARALPGVQADPSRMLVAELTASLKRAKVDARSESSATILALERNTVQLENELMCAKASVQDLQARTQMA